MKLFDNIRAAAAKRAAYNRTRDELARLPLDAQLDLGIYAEDAHAIAHRAVYGC